MGVLLKPETSQLRTETKQEKGMSDSLYISLYIICDVSARRQNDILPTGFGG